MLEFVLTQKNASVRKKITLKSLLAAGIVLLAVLLPLAVHAAAGEDGGVTWLPMYFPVLLGGCLLGLRWGLGIGIASPIVSFFLTSAMGDAMPAAARLPFMAAELAVFASVSGLFSRKIYHNGWMAFPAVLLAAVSGRALFLAAAIGLQAIAPWPVSAVWAQIQSGAIGLLVQAVAVPLIVIGLRAILRKES